MIQINTRWNSAEVRAVEYLRSLNENVLEWYRIADSKAQTILTLDGVLIAIVSAGIFTSPGEIVARKHLVNAVSWTLLGASAVAVVCSVACAVACLYSRIGTAHLQQIIHQTGVEPHDLETYKPHVAGWFGFIAVLPHDEITSYLLSVDDAIESSALAANTARLSANVLRKHRWVNRGWVMSATSLIALLLAGISYVIGA